MKREVGTCKHCGQMSMRNSNLGLKWSPGKQWLCPACYKELIMKCPMCEKDVPRETMPKKAILQGGVSFELEVCPNCAAHMVPCSQCGETVYWDKGQASHIYADPSKPICSDCVKELYLECPDCHKLANKRTFTNYDYYDRERNTYITKSSCSKCISNISIESCSYCGRKHQVQLDLPNYTPIQEMYGQMMRLCYTCAKALTECSDCGTRYIAVSSRPTGGELNCYLVRNRYQGCPGCAHMYEVHSYSFKPTPNFSYLPGDPDLATPSGPLYLGIELEIDRISHQSDDDDDEDEIEDDDEDMVNQPNATQIIKGVGGRYLYLKTDGSLSSQGLELVTHPATLKYIMENREKYANMCLVPKKLGYVSHDGGRCGLHVHVNKKFYSGPRSKENLAKLIWLMERYWPQMFIFSRRAGSDIKQWASRYLGPQDAKNILRIEKTKGLDVATHSGSRYKALNLQPSHTFEYRLFRGTLNVTTFFATLQLVDNLTRIARETSLSNLDKLRWLDIINYASYPELTEYNERRVEKCHFGVDKVHVPGIQDKGFTDIIDSLTIPDHPTAKALGNTEVFALEIPSDMSLISHMASIMNDTGGCWYLPTKSWLDGGLLLDDRFNIRDVSRSMLHLEHTEHHRFRRAVDNGYIIGLYRLLTSSAKGMVEKLSTVIGLE